MPSAARHSYSGQPMHFHSGVDTEAPKRQGGALSVNDLSPQVNVIGAELI